MEKKQSVPDMIEQAFESPGLIYDKNFRQLIRSTWHSQMVDAHISGQEEPTLPDKDISEKNYTTRAEQHLFDTYNFPTDY